MLALKGIDVSSWQGYIDWEKVKGDGIQFAILRVSAGTNLDRYFVNNILGATKNNIPCGVYVYSYAATPAMAEQEAEFVLHAISPYSITYPVFFDIEDKVQHNLTKGKRTDIVEAFCQKVQGAGYTPGVYSSLSWFKSYLDLTRLTNYEKWVAQWGVQQCSFAGDFGLWQNSDSGKVAGIQGNVDMDVCYKDYANNTNPKPVPPPAQPPASTPTPTPGSQAGRKLILKNVPLFASAKAKTSASTVTGTYWVYDDGVTNGRIRITNSANSVGKTPAAQNVTGFINQSDIG